ncbi:cubilin-like [Argonauta hians]
MGFLLVVLLALLGNITSKQLKGKTGFIECSPNLKDRVCEGIESTSGSVVSVGYPSNYDSTSACQVHLCTCKSCRFEIELETLHFPSCNASFWKNHTTDTNKENLCINGCDHLHISEVDHPYNLFSRRNYFDVNQTSTYVSLSSLIRIVHCVSSTKMAAGKRFKVNYRVVVKKEEFSGFPQKESSSDGSFHSPNFPRGYAINGETFSYSMQNLDPNGFIKLIFDDWDVAHDSVVQVFEKNQNVPVTLRHFQRPMIISHSNYLQLVFYTGSNWSSYNENIGFKVSFKYLSEKFDENTKLDCGATYSTCPGGMITFYGTASVQYDCVWVVRKVFLKTLNYNIHLHLKEISVEEGQKLEPGNSLMIHNGISSVDSVIARYTSNEHFSVFNWSTTLQSEGFYIRLRGNFERVIFSFVTGVIMPKDGCPENFKFPCFNLLCIPEVLKCDKIDHCGDNSDESPALNCDYETTTATKSKPCSEFLCDKQVCLNKSTLCNNIEDCIDGTDEKFCNVTSPNLGQIHSQDKTVLYFLICFCISKEFV